MAVLQGFIAFQDPKRNLRVSGLLAACDVQAISAEDLPKADLSRLLFLTDQVQMLGAHPELKQARERVLFLPDAEIDEAKDHEALRKFNHVLIVRTDPPEDFPAGKVIAIARATRKFGLDILDHVDHGAIVKEFQLSSSDQRIWFREELNNYISSFMEALPRPSPVYSQYATEIQDELLMNAIWDACPERARISRREVVRLAPNENVTVRWAFDGSKFAIAVRDRFGTFPPDLYEKYLHAMFFPEARTGISVQQDSAGAGIGMFMILQRASQVTVNVARDRFTEVVVTLNFSQGPKNMARGTKTFQFFNLGGN